ncbi:MAG: hypothetical protein Q9227_004021 [Pyrenula ochraceoflavens]
MPPATSTDDLRNALQTLMDAVASNPSFSTQQSAQRGKLFFMWDFVSNTQKMLGDPNELRPSVPRGKNRKEIQSDVSGRCMFQDLLFNDTTGKLAMMTGGDQTEFDANVKEKSKHANEIIIEE